MNKTYFYKDKPIFGLDIGFSSLKVMQIDAPNKRQAIAGYGVGSFDSSFIKDGLIVDYEGLAKAAKELFAKNIIGNISTRRVVIAIPAAKAFNRAITLPHLKSNQIAEAIRLETEQYVPVPIDELYMDYSVIDEDDKNTEVLAVAAPKNIIDSYLTLTRLIGLEAVAFETNISAASRLFTQAENSDIPTILIDFGSVSTDITIIDKVLVVTGTVAVGGDNFTDLISEKLSVPKQEAHVIKTKYGLNFSKKQSDITDAIGPELEKLLREVRKMIRYYEERSGTKNKISQIVTMGGGANMPGLSEYMTNQLRMPVRMCDPWQNLHFDNLQPPGNIEKSMYVTVAGLSLANPKEAFTS